MPTLARSPDPITRSRIRLRQYTPAPVDLLEREHGLERVLGPIFGRDPGECQFDEAEIRQPRGSGATGLQRRRARIAED